MRWLVDRKLRLQTLEPDDENLLRGAAAHAALERALRRLVRENGSSVLSPDRLPAAREAVEAPPEGLHPDCAAPPLYVYVKVGPDWRPTFRE